MLRDKGATRVNLCSVFKFGRININCIYKSLPIFINIFTRIEKRFNALYVLK